MAKILVVGRFDVLHSGHFNLLAEARRIADDTARSEVLIAIDTDRRISETSKKLPMFMQDERMHQLEVLKIKDKSIADRVVLFDTDHELILIIKSFGPEFMMKGSEWKGKPIIGEKLTHVHFYDAVPEKSKEKISSSNIINRILFKHGHLKNS